MTWNTKKQTIVALSSTKAGCMTLTKGMKEANIWLCRLFQKIQVLQGTTPTMIIEDNQGKLKLTQPNFLFSDKTCGCLRPFHSRKGGIRLRYSRLCF